MRSTFSGLNSVVRGIYAQQLSLDTVGHNISNANNEGYSRQRVNLSTTLPEVVYGGVGALQVGTGVAIESVTRARDIFMDRQYWKESSSLGYGSAAVSTYSQIEGIFHDEVGDAGLQTVLNNFWDSWQTLTTSASNESSRIAVRERGAELVEAVKHAASQLEDMVTSINDTLKSKVAEINETASQIYKLNIQIANIEVGGREHANDLRDRRDLLTDNLSKMMNVRVSEDSNHNYVIQASDVVIADGSGYTPLALNSQATSMDPDYDFEVRYVVVAGSDNQKVNFTNGEMKALQETNSTIAQKYLDDLSTISKFLLQEFNAVHRSGYGTDNSTGNNFFGLPSVNYGNPTAVPPVAGPAYSKGDWLKALSINSDLYNDGGIAKIAAKTLIGSTATQSNAAGGQGTIGTQATGYTGTTSTFHSYQVTITADPGTHAVTGVNYSVDGVVIGAGTAVVPATAPPTYILNNGLTIQIATDPQNTTGDTYTFSVPQGNASGDNATLLANKLKSPTPSTSGLGGASLDDYYKSIIGELGVQSQTNSRLVANQETLVNQIQNWREATAGVNIDEEMTNMIRFQKGYNAAARVLTSMDEMLDKLINSTGVVGR